MRSCGEQTVDVARSLGGEDKPLSVDSVGVRQLVINADDLGLCRGVNQAVDHAHRNGILTSASLMATGPCFDDALETVIARNPGLGIGAHLCLTSGRGLLGYDAIPDLVDSQGRFRHGFVTLLRLVNMRGKEVLDQIERELQAQLRKIQTAGIEIDHLNSHRHVHMIPQILEIVVRLAAEFGQPIVRISKEPWRLRTHFTTPRHLPRFLGNAPKNLVLRALSSARRQTLPPSRIRHVYGILGSGRMDSMALEATISRLSDGVSEILTHPSLDLQEPLDEIVPSDKVFVRSADRQKEFKALTNPDVRATLEREHVRVVSFRELTTQRTAIV